LHDFLTEKRNAIDDKYDYRYSVLISVFGKLLGEGLLTKEDFDGLREDKTDKIQAIADIFEEY